MKKEKHTIIHMDVWRLNLVRFMFIILALGLGWRLTDIQVVNTDFLRKEGKARHVRQVSMTAHRGMILDRNGEPLAISTPVYSVWLNPQKVSPYNPNLQQLAHILNIKIGAIRKKIVTNQKREFIYIKRHAIPSVSAEVKKLDITGVALQREYKRYYPTGEITSHVVGFTSIDDVGPDRSEVRSVKQ